jgi:hypothetical protein
VDVDPPDSFSLQFRALEKFKRLAVPGKRGLRQGRKKAKNLTPVPQVPASQFSENKHVPKHLFTAEQRLEPFVPPAEVVDPDGGVDEDHAARAVRLRGGRSRFFSVPPRSARRRALSRAMRASRPIRTKAVFSVTPVSRAASAINVSPIFNVVLICISMHCLYIRVNGRNDRPRWSEGGGIRIRRRCAASRPSSCPAGSRGRISIRGRPSGGTRGRRRRRSSRTTGT